MNSIEQYPLRSIFGEGVGVVRSILIFSETYTASVYVQMLVKEKKS